jgi:gamma-glutamyltranspeptidase / glutathione hydrolase
MKTVLARRAMVITGEAHATETARAVLADGGSAADAAIAAGFVLTVTQPGLCGIGGGGQALVRTSVGQSVFVDFREQAPKQAHPALYEDGTSSAEGWRAAAILFRPYGRRGCGQRLGCGGTRSRRGCC